MSMRANRVVRSVFLMLLMISVASVVAADEAAAEPVPEAAQVGLVVPREGT